MEEMCFAYQDKRFVVIDTITNGLGTYSRETLEQVRERYPNAVIMPYEEAWKKHCDSYLTEPVEITEEDFWYFLEVLSPCSWHRRHDSESFYMSEFTTGDVTLHLVRIGTRYYKFEDHVMKTHEERVEKCLALHRATEEFEGCSK